MGFAWHDSRRRDPGSGGLLPAYSFLALASSAVRQKMSKGRIVGKRFAPCQAATAKRFLPRLQATLPGRRSPYLSLGGLRGANAPQCRSELIIGGAE
jgi:hypothetical protein